MTKKREWRQKKDPQGNWLAPNNITAGSKLTHERDALQLTPAERLRLDVHTVQNHHFWEDHGPMHGFCARAIFGTWSHHQCSNKARVMEEGFGWCKRHAPSRVRADRAAREAKWRAKDDLLRETRARQQAHHAFRDACERLVLRMARGELDGHNDLPGLARLLIEENFPDGYPEE